MVKLLMEKETINRDEVAEVFKSIKKVKIQMEKIKFLYRNSPRIFHIVESYSQRLLMMVNHIM